MFWNESFPPGQFCWLTTVFLSVFIGMGMVVVFSYILEKIYHPKFYQWIKTEGFSVETYLRNKKKWLLSCSFNPTKMQISNHLTELSKNTDLYLSKYDQLLFLTDFNAGVEDSSGKNFVLVMILQV